MSTKVIGNIGKIPLTAWLTRQAFISLGLEAEKSKNQERQI